jgi:protein transport protein SEC61 subunit alpha
LYGYLYSEALLITHRPLELVRPFLSVLPDIEPPERRVSFREKAGYTATALFVFLVCSQLPLYGIKTNSGSDPFYWARVIMASNRYVHLDTAASAVTIVLHEGVPP